MYDPKGDDPVKLRRFALALAAVLFAYALVGIQVKAEVQFLGIPFIVRRPELLPLALSAVAVWAMARFWYYAMILNVSPTHARRQLKRGRLPDGQRLSAPDGPSNSGKNSQLEGVLGRYFPAPVGESSVEYLLKTDGTTWSFTIKRIPWRNRLLALGEDLDFTAPLWLTAVAVVAITISAWSTPASVRPAPALPAPPPTSIWRQPDVHGSACGDLSGLSPFLSAKSGADSRPPTPT